MREAVANFRISNNSRAKGVLQENRVIYITDVQSFVRVIGKRNGNFVLSASTVLISLDTIEKRNSKLLWFANFDQSIPVGRNDSIQAFNGLAT